MSVRTERPPSIAWRVSAAARTWIGRAVNLLRGPRPWSELATRLISSGRVHQANSLTWQDRYPVLFDAGRMLLADRPAARILSFGCSSGEEVLTLRKYFPAARIVGAEINPYLLRACRRLPTDAATNFILSSGDSLRAHGPYDAIFCMAVLTRRPEEVGARRISNIRDLYRFEDFAREVRLLASLLKPGGFLVVEHTLYRVEDAIDGLDLSPVTSHGYWPAKGPRFRPTGDLVAPQPVVARFFRKQMA